ncbi:cation-transporting P-type ATPase [Micromonospora sp. NBC_00898]|nr:cation-transporting P-type ATPase [Micromonospora sp. NBC_00898]
MPQGLRPRRARTDPAGTTQARWLPQPIIRWSATSLRHLGPYPRTPRLNEQLLGDLKTSLDGRSTAEAHQRLAEYGPNELRRQGGTRWWRELVRQLIHPLALVLWLAAVLAWVAGTPVLAAAIMAVILINAVFAFA